MSSKKQTIFQTLPLETKAPHSPGKSNRIVHWLGGVTHDSLNRVLHEIRALMAENKDEEITLFLNSYGGATGVAMSFFDAINSWLKPNLITVGSGDVDSSGIIIFLAGKKRYLTKNTTLLFHLAGRTFDSSKRFSTADVATMLKEDKLKDYQYACTVAERSGGKLTTEKVLRLMNKGTIMTPLEAVAHGIADKVLE